MPEKENKDFKNSTICCICDVDIDGDVKAWNHCHITGKNETLQIEIVIVEVKLEYIYKKSFKYI